jgi:predicted transcriptional regulator
VWSRLKKGASMNELQRDVPRNSYALYRTVVSLVDTGQVE